ncbi:hypothetical protein B0T26DRAFT_743893 [Lasiosphaeria miniovina]|uniref:EamA domain-containing protein n=1 Tax=Lasiosphaeria miniovina TaxID=1954250 RepID=A0AA39ZZY2_9PEZI|nr:uncharacterized protein B0T26DRAFT_743893 [Lasiosphaeria miniovina]KAK0706722.1 hypothetical protein B0T26DRAFT_743893 [Lasiosphaeria miniovina]
MTYFLQIPQTPRSKTRIEDGEYDDITGHLPSSPYKQDSSLLSLDALRSLSGSPFSEHGPLSPAMSRAPSPCPPPLHPRTWSRPFFEQAWARFWGRNRGVVLVGVAQLFGALMNLAARLLELDGEGMHPFQILFGRMSITTVLACIYMWWTKVPHFPLGARGVRGLLLARGFTGFFGIFSMWYSMMYLPLAEATVITFLAPSLSGYICHLVLKDPFTRKEQLASFIALGGVILIARPTSLFSGSTPAGEIITGPIDVTVRSTNTTHTTPHQGDEPTPAERLFATGVALIGVLGAAGAFTLIRWIGKRAHPLISVTYFSTWSTLVSTAALLFFPMLDIGQPEIRFGMPASAYQWFLLLSLGLSGFIMQFMLTAGLGGEKSNRATAMVYTHMLFAAGFDKWVFGHEMGVISLIGCTLIVGSALWAALAKKEPAKKAGESVPMLRDNGGEDEQEDDEDGAFVLRQVR